MQCAERGQVCTWPRKERPEEQDLDRCIDTVQECTERSPQGRSTMSLGWPRSQVSPQLICCPSTVAIHLGSDPSLSETHWLRSQPRVARFVEEGGAGLSGGRTCYLSPRPSLHQVKRKHLVRLGKHGGPPGCCPVSSQPGFPGEPPCHGTLPPQIAMTMDFQNRSPWSL